MTPREKELLDQIRATYPRLDGWFARTSREVETPQRGSELFYDAEVFPHSSISEIARISLAISVENLRMIGVVIESRNLFPTAMFPPLRAALVGAAQAVWILSPDAASDRRKRGLTVIAEEYEQLEKYYREGETLRAGEVPADQWEWLNSRMAALAALRGPTPARLVQTDMIAAALGAAFPGSLERQHSGRLLWRQTSADAHVLVWGVAQRSAVQALPQRGGNLSVLAASFLGAAAATGGLCAGAVALAPAALAAPVYANCTALHRTYPHGVGRSNAHDKTSGRPVTTFKKDTTAYNRAVRANSDLDRDGIACEKR